MFAATGRSKALRQCSLFAYVMFEGQSDRDAWRRACAERESLGAEAMVNVQVCMGRKS